MTVQVASLFQGIQERADSVDVHGRASRYTALSPARDDQVPKPGGAHHHCWWLRLHVNTKSITPSALYKPECFQTQPPPRTASPPDPTYSRVYSAFQVASFLNRLWWQKERSQSQEQCCAAILTPKTLISNGARYKDGKI